MELPDEHDRKADVDQIANGVEDCFPSVSGCNSPVNNHVKSFSERALARIFGVNWMRKVHRGGPNSP